MYDLGSYVLYRVVMTSPLCKGREEARSITNDPAGVQRHEFVVIEIVTTLTEVEVWGFIKTDDDVVLWFSNSVVW